MVCSLVYSHAFYLPRLQMTMRSLVHLKKAELKRLLELDFRELGSVPIRSVLGYEQEHWRNPASVHVIRPDDISLNGHVLMVDSFRNVAGMYVTRGVGYDDFVTITLADRRRKSFLL